MIKVKKADKFSAINLMKPILREVSKLGIKHTITDDKIIIDIPKYIPKE